MFVKLGSVEQYHEFLANYELLVAFVFLVAICAMLFLIQANDKVKRPALNMPLSVGVMVAIGLMLRLPLMFRPYWYDETFTSAIVESSSFWTAISGDVHPPLYYLIVKAFVMVLGYHDFVMRLPALLSGLAIIPVMYAIGKHHHGEAVGKWTAFLTAILPATVYYSAEARYPMMLALMLAVAYLNLIEHQKLKDITSSANTKHYQLRFALSLCVAGGLHVNAWFYIALLGLWYLAHNHSVRDVLLVMVAGASAMAWLPMALHQASDVANGFWLTQYSPYRHILEMTIGNKFWSSLWAFLPQVASMLIILLSFVMYRRRANALWLVMVAGVPAVQAIVSILWHPIYLPRTLLFSSLLMMIPVALWIHRYRLNWLALAGLVAALVGIMNMMPMSEPRETIYDVLETCGDSSTIYATSTHVGILLKHFSDKPVIVFEDGNSMAQELPLDSRLAIFDGVGNINNLPHEGVCVVGMMELLNEPQEVHHLNSIGILYPVKIRELPKEGSEIVYYIVMTFETVEGWKP